MQNSGNRRSGGDRQWGTNLSLIRADHVARYRFAEQFLAKAMPPPATVLDVACGCGYGSRILHDAGYAVTGIDIEKEALDFARDHYAGPTYIQQAAQDIRNVEADALVFFETLEHLPDPETVLQNIKARIVIASVPNEERFGFSPDKFKGDKYPHLRHYTPAQFEALLNGCGYEVTGWVCQKEKSGEITEGTDGRFVIATARPK